MIASRFFAVGALSSAWVASKIVGWVREAEAWPGVLRQTAASRQAAATDPARRLREGGIASGS